MKKIAVIVETSRAYGRGIIEGIADYAQENGNWILRYVPFKAALSTDFASFDGVIARLADERLANRILRSRIPAVDVFCQKPRLGIAGVDSDHQRIGAMAKNLLHSRGFANLAYCGIAGTAFSQAREKAFADAHTYVYNAKLSHANDETQFYDERLDRLPDARALARWLKSLPKPIAVFCCNDLRAIQVQRVAIENGWRVPQDLSILGVDNDTIACSFAEVPLSSITPNAHEIGYAAARILGAILIRRPDRKLHRIHRVKPGDIIERTSTEFMPLDPPWLGKALIHIERNMRRSIAAREIFELSERSGTFVESVFKAKLGLPVQAYITSVKMREARRLIADSSLRISEIGYRCGFASPQYFCRTFSAFFGISPKKLRAAEN